MFKISQEEIAKAGGPANIVDVDLYDDCTVIYFI